MNESSGEDKVALVAEMGGEREEKWWRKVVDTTEARKQAELAVPMVLTNVFYFLIPLVSVMFAGHLGQLQLAGSTLANSWATVTGFAFMRLVCWVITFKSMEDGKTRIAKFDGKDIDFWRLQIEDMLYQKDL